MAGVWKERSACSGQPFHVVDTQRGSSLVGTRGQAGQPYLKSTIVLPKVAWVSVVEGMGIKGREVPGLPAVFIYSSKTSI